MGYCYSSLSAENEITIVNMTTVIPPGVSEACILVLAVDDEIVESNELFYVTVDMGNPRDTVSGNATLTVADNDGKDILSTRNHCTVTLMYRHE